MRFICRCARGRRRKKGCWRRMGSWWRAKKCCSTWPWANGSRMMPGSRFAGDASTRPVGAVVGVDGRQSGIAESRTPGIPPRVATTMPRSPDSIRHEDHLVSVGGLRRERTDRAGNASTSDHSGGSICQKSPGEEGRQIAIPSLLDDILIEKKSPFTKTVGNFHRSIQ